MTVKKGKKKKSTYVGKRWEKEFRDIMVDAGFWCRRFNDSFTTRKNADGKWIRIAAESPPDYMVIADGVPVLVECKSYEGTNFPYSNITLNQLEDLKTFPGAGIIAVEYRAPAGRRAYFVKIDDYLQYFVDKNRKSVSSLDWDSLGLRINKVRGEGYVLDAKRFIEFIQQ
jgi:penicillin-binding protein-related factor A (putative recombinase)